MIQEERLVQIKKMLKKEHQVSTKEIAKKFGVSFDTARRDVIHFNRHVERSHSEESHYRSSSQNPRRDDGN